MSRFKPTHYGEIADSPPAMPAAAASAPAAKKPVRPVKTSAPAVATAPPRMVAALRTGAAAPGRLGIFAKLLATIFGFYLFLQLWFAPEIVYLMSGKQLKFIFVLWVVLALASLWTGNVSRFLKSPFAIPWLALMGWMFVSAAAGLYPRGSLEFLWEYALRTHLAPFLFCSIVLTAAHVRRLVYWMAGAMPVLLILCWRLGEVEEGRISIPDTSMGNPNELAFLLLFVSAFLLMMLFSSSGVLRVSWLFVFGFTSYYIMQTASRGNFLTLVVVALAMIVASPGRIRFALGALLPIVGVIVLAAMPGATLDRLKLLLPSTVISDQLQAAAAGSQEARLILQKRALQLTIMNPVFGVGPRMFSDAVDEMVRDTEGRKSFWQEAHNSYLQIAAETGLLGFLLYTYCVYLCLRLNYKTYRANMSRPDRQSIAGVTMCLFLASVVYAFGTLFNSLAYFPYLAMLIGLTATNHLAIQDLDFQDQALAQEPAAG